MSTARSVSQPVTAAVPRTATEALRCLSRVSWPSARVGEEVCECEGAWLALTPAPPSPVTLNGKRHSVMQKRQTPHDHMSALKPSYLDNTMCGTQLS
jgi:hypothetical protein